MKLASRYDQHAVQRRFLDPLVLIHCGPAAITSSISLLVALGRSASAVQRPGLDSSAQRRQELPLKIHESQCSR